MPAQTIDGGALFAASLRLMRENALLLAGLPFVINLCLNAVSSVMGPAGGVLSLLLPPLVSGLMTLVAADLLAGTRIELNGRIQRVLAVFGPLIVLSLVATLASVIGLMALIVPGLYVGAVMLPLVAVILFEDEGWASIGRAYDMSQPVVWPLVGVVLRLTVLGAACLLPLLLVIGSIAASDTPGPMILLNGLLIFVSSTLASTVAVTGLLVYQELR